MRKLITIFSIVVIFNPALGQNVDSIASDGVNKKRLHTFILVGSSAYVLSLVAPHKYDFFSGKPDHCKTLVVANPI